MSNTSATKHKDSFMIMLPIEDKQILSENLISPIYRVEGLAWYVHVAFFYDGNVDGFNMMSPSLHCDLEVSHTFASWKQRSNMCKLPLLPFTAEFISITIETESESSACRLTLDVTLIPDVILVMEGQKFPVNK
ncbi:hypothetical protein PENTCL1PPCAC_7342 [Pristionchus entomophagus]|uniref:MATH domain-containing protein n=1 Tax=Pristionchus entomophagus TaxID=358040 RepID=A0AAV5SP89_9BILA|nr:hypothetical protein PENTCL1PPCAC_7342 [Pristionchus entomophagus]